MYPRIITLATAALCAAQLHVSAATFQPVEDGLQPLYARIAAINIEVQTLESTLARLDSQTQERSLAEEKIKILRSEWGRLEGEIMWARNHARSSLVTYTMPSAE